MAKAHKYIFVAGGVMSGVGKGVATSSIALLLQARGFKISPIKIDPYLNVDAGTMNPTEHGEVFVLKSGLETDQDMGSYERFLGRDLNTENYMTGGLIYKTVIDRERALGYGGRCVEPVPHIPEEVIRRIKDAGEKDKSDITIVEIGGTLGEYQSVMFIEAARTLKMANPDDVLFVLVTYLPVPGKLGEMKTKPTQYAVRTMNSYGVQPDIIIARGEVPVDMKRKEKIASSSGMRVEQVISAPDVDSVYDVPLNFEADNIATIVMKLLKLKSKKPVDLAPWKGFVRKTKNTKGEVRIGMVGKYFATGDFVLADSYLSVIEALKYAAFHAGKRPVIDWIAATDFEGTNAAKNCAKLAQYDGIVVPGGFGARGIEGKLNVIKYVRTHKIPYFGLCYGMQLMVAEYARNVLGLKGAITTEIDPKTKYPVVAVMPDQQVKLDAGDYGGSMRLGSYPAYLKEGTVARGAYKAEMVHERHRHRYEVNPEYVAAIEKAGLVFSGISPDEKLMEIAELPKLKHPFFLGTQFHPEFTARPLTSHPLFDAFIKACVSSRATSKKK
ncbi:MAG: CTP synthase [Candidatus Lloydbacteria bacterium RIFCSPHIGHO2_01_FULL_49_22]|uniref:CTP synthase n=1 Tax=Candidatus Lloydbacteria bacterium RIFCSPHIGHO2_01_FULL_49_22 TaxID=1798658 RepID=A0A1G2CXS9_9BACT|nr:MAG: CTP synthase [Candidatus Lloydbacteria bacterium RIFCSPHIGHO2_01_FULL_49_22]OGZ09968.1 MAG: CTP synthase [Candidatus Lloydbacteria bacterium RIFCSPHIGHO2_02_FULL_50_18]